MRACWAERGKSAKVVISGQNARRVIFGAINATLRPLMKLLTCPLILLTLGLFALIVNGLMLWLTSTIAESLGLAFRVTGFWPAFWGALVVSIVSTLLSISIRTGDPADQQN